MSLSSVIIYIDDTLILAKFSNVILLHTVYPLQKDTTQDLTESHSDDTILIRAHESTAQFLSE